MSLVLKKTLADKAPSLFTCCQVSCNVAFSGLALMQLYLETRLNQLHDLSATFVPNKVKVVID